MIYVLGGTKDSREIIEYLLRADYEVLASVVSNYGQSLLAEIGDIKIITERLDKEDMKQVIKNYEIEIVIDATHPFARKVSQNVIEVTKELGIESIRFERETLNLPDSDLIIEKSGFQPAIEYLKENSRRTLLTIGSKELEKFTAGISDFRQRIVVRVLPTAGVIEKCQRKLSIPPANIIAMQGPFSYELNKQLSIDYEIELLVTKASGKTGGLDTKLKAAHDLNIPVLVITRPELDYPQVISDYRDLLASLDEGVAD